jgi:hypothetical protein
MSNDILDLPIVSLSEKDQLTFRMLIEGGTLITGGLGSGKSSTSGKALALGFLRAGMGGLVLTVKSDETQHFLEYAAKAGRNKDVIVFNAESDLTFDPLAYVCANSGRGGAFLETIIELFMTLLSIGKAKVTESSEGRYFELAVEELMRAVLTMLFLGGESVSIMSIHTIIISLPTRPDQIEELDWQNNPAGKLVNKIKARKESLTESQWQDLENALHFALELWPNEDHRTRSNVLSTWSGMASKFTYDPLRRLFCSGKYSFTPEQTTHEHKIVILDMPVLEYGREASRLSQILVKIIFQRAWLRHQYKPGCCNGAFLFQDEFSLLMHRHENHFHQVCRGSAIAPVCLTTNMMSIAAEEFGESNPGSRTFGFLNNLTIKIFHAQTDGDYGARVLGKEYRYIDNYGATVPTNPGHGHATFGGSKQLVPVLESIEFTRLLKPDGSNPFAEAIVHKGGGIFNGSVSERNPEGSNYLRVLFSRDI